jgi:MoaA/NifB/PqqE/SkfB family radical SAM enzyme
MSYETAICVADIIRAAGVQGVVISGGEPTLLPYLTDLVAYLRSDLPTGGPGPQVVLSTNGLAPMAVMQRILPNLSWIALPLESGVLDEHKALRTGVAGHRDRVLGLLADVRKNHAGVGVKLGTVVTRRNTSGAAQVLDLIEDYALPDVWKVYQMSETNYGADNRDFLAIDNQTFEDVVEQCAAAASKRGVRLRVYRNSTRSGSYLFIDPDCRMVVIEDGSERAIGGLFDEIGGLTSALAAHALGRRLVDNYTGTYPEL